MKAPVSLVTLFGVLAAGLPVCGGCGPAATDERVLPLSLDLERRTQPWCPGDCEHAIPFVASYRRGNEVLVFVGVRHAFDPENPTMRAVAAGFSSLTPAVVVLEGFPSALGENPSPLVEIAKRHGAGESEGFARGEAMYAASLALARGIPFLGGEPTQEEQLNGLRVEGYADTELAFDAVLGWFSQSLRSGEVPDNSVASLNGIYPELVDAVRNQTGLEAPSIEAFRRRYEELYGVDIVGDSQFLHRTDIFDTSARARLSVAKTMIRDRHILSVIEEQLTRRRTVLVVYGGSHWSTLSAVLEARLGKPQVTPYRQ